MAKERDDELEPGHESRLSTLERSVRDMIRTWNEERENIYGAINKLGAEFRTEFKAITAKLSEVGKPNWQLIAVLMSMMVALSALLMFVIQASIAPIDARLHNVERDQDERAKAVELNIRNDERWSLWLSGHIRQQPETPASKPAN